MIVEMANASQKTIRVNGTPLLVGQLLQDAQLIGALLKIGLFSVGAQSFSDMRMESFGGRTEAAPMKSVPVAMIGLAFSYALKVSPEKKEDILKESRRLEYHFGPIPLDSILMSELASLTQSKDD